MRKKMLLVAVLLTVFAAKSNACGWYSPDNEYFNLFAQEIMKDPRYRPFLLTYENRFYPNEGVRNANIEEWQAFLGLSYDDTRYLVFESSREDLQQLTKGKSAADSRLSFATPEFVKKHKQSLLYLAYAKYLEPYMYIAPDEKSDDDNGYWWYGDGHEHDASELDYDKVKTVLTKSWAAESDNELKLRYGYQMVRLAHYTRRYAEAVKLFDQYVEPLGLKTEVYYYALSQKAGALSGMGEKEKANREFVRVFANSVDLKVSAYTSMTMGWDNQISFNEFVAGAANDNERNDIYFLMGYSEFNNPTNEIAKIVANNPDAIQAKVLMVRAINVIERNLLGGQNCHEDANARDSRYPAICSDEIKAFLNQTLSISDKQCNAASDKNFWNLASSYLHFLNKDYDKASENLSHVKSNDELYMTMVHNLTAYIDICRQPKITPDVERTLFANYKDVMTSGVSGFNSYDWDGSFIQKVMANRYELQGDVAKCFLVKNSLKAIEDNPNETLLAELQSFLNKKKKTPYEEYIATSSTIGVANTNNYIAYVKGVLRLTEGDLKTAKSCFEKQTRLSVSKRIFGHNIMVWYSGEENLVMRDDYIDEFPFIQDKMTELEVTDALMQLQKIGSKEKDDYSAKANYLIANFFYNVSVTGYYRHYLRFDNNNGYCDYKYGSYGDNVYKNTLELSRTYLEKARKTATNNELKAHIAFAMAKNAQQDLEATARSSWDYSMVIPDHQFEELDQYKGTEYHSAVYSNCLYYRDYHN